MYYVCRYGTPGLTTESTHNSVLELDGELLSRRGNYSWLDEQSEDFAKAVYLVHFAGFVHK